MRIIVEVREDAFRKHKTAKQIQNDVREGATMLWLARGEVGPAEASSVVAPLPLTEDAGAPSTPEPPAEAAPPQEPTLMDVLLSMPDVGEDSDFERPASHARPDVDLDCPEVA